MKVFAMSRLFAKHVAETCAYWHSIISITDPNNELPVFPPNEKRIAVLGQHFYDIDFSKKMTPLDEFDMKKIYGHGLFTDDQAREIVAFVRRHIDATKLLIIHCDAGVSRSAGVAGAILKATTGSDEKIFKDPMFIPNMWVYRKVLNAWHEEDDHGREDEGDREV